MPRGQGRDSDLDLESVSQGELSPNRSGGLIKRLKGPALLMPLPCQFLASTHS